MVAFAFFMVKKVLGYNSQTALARAIYETGKSGHCSAESTRAYLSQVLNGKRPMSDSLKEALVSLGINESIIEQIKGNLVGRIKDIDQSLYDTFRGYVLRLDECFKESDRNIKLKYLASLEKICNEL